MSTTSHAAHEGHHHAHHFESAEHEFETSKLGMWIFLATEILFFSGLFLAYATYKGLHPETFYGAHKLLDWKLGAVNTVILICSSLTMALAIRSAQLNQKGNTVLFLVLTLACAAGFLVVKYFEYSHKIHVGTLPGQWYSYSGPELLHLKDPHIYFGCYFMMTGLHGIHVVGGMVVIFWMLMRASRGEFSSQYYMPLELTGLYWHLVDLIWIYLFPLLYLVG